MRGLLISAVALLALVGPAAADARVSRGTAFLVSLHDVQTIASELGSRSDYSIPACGRINRRRVDCRVSASGSDFEVSPDPEVGSYYLHRWCRWVVVTRQWRLYPYYRAHRRGIRCKRWITDSP